jgi:hypothetical protein
MFASSACSRADSGRRSSDAVSVRQESAAASVALLDCRAACHVGSA